MKRSKQLPKPSAPRRKSRSDGNAPKRGQSGARIQLASWNVNGIRAAARHGFLKWFSGQSLDVVCLQEIKAEPAQLEENILHPGKFHSYWHPAKKPGYSGVAIMSKREPRRVQYGIGDKEIDDEGRVITAEFDNHTVISAYFPNSQRDHSRLPFKLKFCRLFFAHCEAERRRGNALILCGDFNIAHREIDLRNPKTNISNAGFLPQERAWMSEFLGAGYVDTFRYFVPEETGHYTWWSYRPGVRARNIGWRLDYFICDAESEPRLRSVRHQAEIMGSDHCPVLLTFAG